MHIHTGVGVGGVKAILLGREDVAILDTLSGSL